MALLKDSPLALRYAGITVVVGGLGALFFAIANGLGQQPVTAQDFVDLQQGASPHLGFRRAHAKGFCVAGEFVANGELSSFSSAGIFQNGATPFLGRISTAGNNPTAPDLAAPVRSLALSFGSGSTRWQTAMNTPPVMPVRTPADFHKQIVALSPDPETGERDPARIGAFFAEHPETQAFLTWQASYSPTGSFATERYHSINAFYLIDANGNRQAVRWAAVPVDSATSDPAALDTDNPDVLIHEFMARLEHGPVEFNFNFTLANADDDPADPTLLWGEGHQQVSAGTLIIHEAYMASNEAGRNCDALNFDPLILPKGMAATQDQILRARSAAYAESYRRRARENAFNQRTEAQP
ncbi:MAG: catalase family peroxidase [Idiomarina sp.]|nr:catalase family peroxidase [Idiomarina sp.]